eukprot:TRINITY_DN11132_c0_g1_i2.p1 TRINITY_DN11132_c0_g1~~TRINITY_DN11132_c0_g1_i2.p1  ORF type:complete len:123 (-),score=14.58 TRINITY_DN11132_c0_g1_i2:379-747(-)
MSFKSILAKLENSSLASITKSNPPTSVEKLETPSENYDSKVQHLVELFPGTDLSTIESVLKQEHYAVEKAIDTLIRCGDKSTYTTINVQDIIDTTESEKYPRNLKMVGKYMRIHIYLALLKE